MTAPGPRALTRSLAAEAEVGSNQRGAVSGAGWLYALPRLSFRRAVCIGSPSAATVAGLVRAVDVLHVVDADAASRSRIERLAARSGWTAVLTHTDALDLPEAPVDLLVMGSDDHVNAWAAARLLERLTPDGVTYFEGGGDARAWVDLGPGHAALDLAVAPASGQARSAVPVRDAALRATLHRLDLEGRWVPSDPRLARLVRHLPRPVAGLLVRRRHRAGLIVGRPEDVGPQVPAYVRDIAAAGGRDLDGWGWAIAARGDYDSQKVLMLLRPPGAAEPSGLVKITRSDGHRARLENEGRALERLATLPVAAGRAPVPWFAGRHAGRAVLGISMIDGAGFRARATWRPDDPALADAIGWLTDLAVATRVDTPAAVVGQALLTLLDRFERVYRPSDAERRALRDRFEALGRLGADIPTVLQHGDPGIWNLIVDDAGRTVFLDWESAEADGLPLWDLLYLARSYAVAASRRRGARDRLDAAARHLLDTSPLGDRLVDLVATYRERVGVPPAAVEALIYGCWVHRSLKEASRMSPEHLGDGQFVRLIRRMLERPDAPTLARMAGRGS